jgi:hypothetical protein
LAYKRDVDVFQRFLLPRHSPTLDYLVAELGRLSLDLAKDAGVDDQDVRATAQVALASIDAAGLLLSQAVRVHSETELRQKASRLLAAAREHVKLTHQFAEQARAAQARAAALDLPGQRDDARTQREAAEDQRATLKSRQRPKQRG